MEKELVITLSKERKRELTALGIMVCWVIAWIGGWVTGAEIPWPLNVSVTGAAAYLLGTNLPIEVRRKGG